MYICKHVHLRLLLATAAGGRRLWQFESGTALERDGAGVVDPNGVPVERPRQERRQVNQQIAHALVVDFLEPPAAVLLHIRLVVVPAPVPPVLPLPAPPSSAAAILVVVPSAAVLLVSPAAVLVVPTAVLVVPTTALRRVVVAAVVVVDVARVNRRLR